MGLGGIVELKKLLPILFPSCVVQDIPETRQNVDFVIEDMSIYINNVGPVAYSCSKLKSDVRKHVGRTYAKFPKCIFLISLIDDGQHTPMAKKPTQKKRGERPHIEPYQRAALGELYYLTSHGMSEKQERYIIEGVFYEELKSSNKTRKKKEKKGKQAPFNLYINRALGTRDLKADVAHFFTRELLKTPNETFNLMDIERNFIIDGGVWPDSNNPDADSYNDPFGVEKGEIDHEKKLDLSAEGRYNPLRAFDYGTCNIWMEHDSHPKLCENDTRPFLGEADIKIVSWLRSVTGIADGMKEEDPEHLPRSLWVNCSDTDLIIILLLWVRELIDPLTKEFKHNLYLDCTSRKKEKTSGLEKKLSTDENEMRKKFPHIDDTWNPSVEVYDICSMWKAINSTFLRVFPGISNPVEVFCLMVMCGGTDFVEKPTHIGMGAIWKTFCLGGYAYLTRAIRVPTDTIFTDNANIIMDNSNRPIGIIQHYIMEFYRMCYAVAILNQREEFKLIDNTNDHDKYNKEPALSRMQQKLKNITKARTLTQKVQQNIDALRTRISFHQVIMDAVEESKRILDRSIEIENNGAKINEDFLDKVAEASLMAKDSATENDSKVALDYLKDQLKKEEKRLIEKSIELSNEIMDTPDGTPSMNDSNENMGIDHIIMNAKFRTLKRSRSTHEDITRAYELKRQKTKKTAESKGKQPQEWRMKHPFNTAELAACARAITWNFDYWYRAPVDGKKYNDISTVTDAEGKSVFGWIVKEKAEENIKGKAVIEFTANDISNNVLTPVI